MSEEKKPAEGGEREVGNEDAVLEVAVKMGYNPDYDGEDKKSPEEFILASRDIQKTQADSNKRLRSKIDALEGAINDISGVMTRKHEREKKQWQQEIAQWKAKRKEAITDGDAELVDKIDNKIEAVKADAPEMPKIATFNQADVDEFFAENKWAVQGQKDYDPEMAAVLEGELMKHAKVQDGKIVGYNVSPVRIMKKALKDVKALFPENFEEKKPKKVTVPDVEAGGGKPAKVKGKGSAYKDLPDSAKAVAREMEAHGISREDYAKDWFENNK